MSSHIAAVKARYAQNQHDAFRAASATTSAFLGIPIQITEWSGRAAEAIDSQWRTSRFDWVEIMRRHRDPDRLAMAMWTNKDRLAGVALGLSTGQSLMLRFLEGDPSPDCPLKGKRILVALEAATNYAQARGKREIRLQPINEKLVHLYENVYGFTLESPHKQEPYYRKGV